MRVLLTGATGLIGKEVGKLLLEHGHVITAVSRNPERARLELPFPAEIVAWNPDTSPLPSEALKGVEAVVHLAGEPVAEGRWTDEKKARIRDSRVKGTKAIVDAIADDRLAAARIRTFVAGSAIGFYGDRGDESLTEKSNQGDGFLARVTEEWEAASRRFDGRLVHVRTGVALSRQGGALAKLLPIFSRGLGGRVGSGQQWMSWIHIEDLARLFVFCLENENVSGAINGVAPEPAKNERFTVTLARSLGRPVFLPVPEMAIKLALGEMSSAILCSQRVFPEKAQALEFRFAFPELVLALEDLCEPLYDGQHELLAEQWVKRQPEEIFPYFSRETNLEELTPKFLNFHVIGKSTPEIAAGTLIDYRLNVHGLPMKWRTRIEEWQPGQFFTDVQLSGPYKKWHHTHEFIPFGGGTLLRDRVSFKLPLGWLGDTAAGWKVVSDVGEIFAFRRKKIAEVFGEKR